MILNEILVSLELGLIYGIVAVGIYIPFRIMNFPDLTCDGSFVLGSSVSSILLKSHHNPWFALIAALLSGCLAGIITGIIHVYLKITDLLAGILVAFMLYSINLRIMGNIPNITFIESVTIFDQMLLPIVLILISLTVCLVVSYIFMTDFGLTLNAIGQNRLFAQNMGINVSTVIIIGLAISNSLIALGGALLSQYQGFTDISNGIGTVIAGLASVMIGEKILFKRSIVIQIISSIIGSIMYRLLISFALHCDFLGIQTQDLNLVTGIMIISITSLSRRKNANT